MRVFLDTNVLVAAFASRGLCADVLEVVLLKHELILGRSVLGELAKALQKKVKLPARDASAIVAFLTEEAALLVGNSDPVRANVDPDDAIVLGDAVEGGAAAFVTGDARILKLERHGDLGIVSPRAFWEMLRGGTPP